MQQQTLSITSGDAARKIGQSVSAALGLESLGVDLREVALTGGRVGFGRSIGVKTYVSDAQNLSGKRAREVSVDYQLSPEWNITSSASTTGSNEAGITWHKRY